MEIINATPHTLNIVNVKGETVSIAPSGILPRVEEREIRRETLVDFELVTLSAGNVCGLPPAEAGKFYVVSRPVASALVGKRNDILVPGSFIRDEGGNIVGCKGLAQFE